MEMIAHSPKMAKKAGVPQAVGKEFAAADKGKKFKQGGEMAKKSDLKKLFKGKDTKSEELKEAKAIKSGKITPEEYAKGEKSEGTHKMKSGGSCYKDGGSVKPKVSESVRSAKAAAMAQKIKDMQAKRMTKNTSAQQAPPTSITAKRDVRDRKMQAMKAAQQAKAQAKPMQQAPTQSSQQDSMQKMQAMKDTQKMQAMKAMKAAQPVNPSPLPRPQTGTPNPLPVASRAGQPSPMPAEPSYPIGGGAASMNKLKKGGVTKSKIDGVAQRGKTKCMKNGGFVRGADGCATKGKTKGRFV
jgi:hypothetical protein